MPQIKLPATIESIGGQREVQYFTGDGININNRVRSGKTELWDDELEAKAAAHRLKTYSYWVYDSSGHFLCYAVPK